MPVPTAEELDSRLSVVEIENTVQSQDIENINTEVLALQSNKADIATTDSLNAQIDSVRSELLGMINTLNLAQAGIEQTIISNDAFDDSDLQALISQLEAFVLNIKDGTGLSDGSGGTTNLGELILRLNELAGDSSQLKIDVASLQVLTSDMVTQSGIGSAINAEVAAIMSGENFITALRNEFLGASWEGNINNLQTAVDSLQFSLANNDFATSQDITDLSVTLNNTFSSGLSDAKAVYAGYLHYDSATYNFTLPQIGDIVYDTITTGDTEYKANFRQYVGGTLGANEDGWVPFAYSSNDDFMNSVGTAKSLYTDPDGNITGWQYAAGTGIQSSFVISADHFELKGSGANSTVKPIIVNVDANGESTIEFNGKISVSNVNGASSYRGSGNESSMLAVTDPVNGDLFYRTDLTDPAYYTYNSVGGWIAAGTGAAGDSAYQIAVNNGFVGTEAEWLDSLKIRVTGTTKTGNLVTMSFSDGTSDTFTVEDGVSITNVTRSGDIVTVYFSDGTNSTFGLSDGNGIASISKSGETVTVTYDDMTTDTFTVQDGIGVEWKGELPSHPLSPQLNWAYRNTTDGKSYIFNGTSWAVMSQDGISVTSFNKVGSTVTVSYSNGTTDTFTVNDGVSVTGFSRAGDTVTVTYSDATTDTFTLKDGVGIQNISKDGETVTVTYDDSTTDTFTVQDGKSIEWKGELASHPVSPQTNWAYRNTTEGKTYIYNGTSWAVMSTDGVSVVSVDQVGETVTVTYSDGTSDNFTVQNGVGVSSITKNGETVTVTYTDSTSDTFTVPDGNGIASITKTGETLTVTYDDATTSTFTVQDGKSIVWMGELPSPPLSPQENWAYRNTSDGKSYIHDGTSWSVMSQDGVSVTSTTKTGNIVTINYSDGTSDDFVVNDGTGISDITKVGETLTVTYTDSTTSNFTVPNGIGIASITKSGNTVTVTYDDATTDTFTVEDGARGSAQGQYSLDLNTTTAAQALANVPTYFTSATGHTSFIEGDSLILTNTDPNSGWTNVYRYDTGSWIDDTSLTIDGSVIVNGTIVSDKIATDAVTADKISVADLSAVSATLGNVTAGVIGASFLKTDSMRVQGSTYTGNSAPFFINTAVSNTAAAAGSTATTDTITLVSESYGTGYNAHRVLNSNQKRVLILSKELAYHVAWITLYRRIDNDPVGFTAVYASSSGEGGHVKYFYDTTPFNDTAEYFMTITVDGGNSVPVEGTMVCQVSNFD